MGDQFRYSCPSVARARSRSRYAYQLTATDDSPVPDHPVGSSRTGIQSACADPSRALVLRQWQSKTAWSNYAAKHLPLPYGSHENQLIRTNFFNTHPCCLYSTTFAGVQLVKAHSMNCLRLSLAMLCRA